MRNIIADLFRHPRSTISFLLKKYRILNFMVVGAVGYAINMGLYYPLTLAFQTEVTFFGKHFYLPPFLISTYVAATSQYFMNKKWTFNDMGRRSQSYLRYLSAVAVTAVFDIILLFIFVDYGRMPPALAAALAILVMFLVRYAIVGRWVWKKTRVKPEK